MVMVLVCNNQLPVSVEKQNSGNYLVLIVILEVTGYSIITCSILCQKSM